LRLFSFGGYGLAPAALARVVFWRHRMPPVYFLFSALLPSRTDFCEAHSIFFKSGFLNQFQYYELRDVTLLLFFINVFFIRSIGIVPPEMFCISPVNIVTHYPFKACSNVGTCFDCSSPVSVMK